MTGRAQYASKPSRIIYVAPAVLCCLAMVCGFIPALGCLESKPFAYLSLLVFVLSIAIHGYILWQWRRFSNAAPLGYALVQPCLHFIILILALIVGGTDMCAAPAAKPLKWRDYELEYAAKVEP